MIHLRFATLDDADFLLACRNDPETVRQFIQSRRVSPSEHLRWLKAILKNPRRRLFVAERTELRNMEFDPDQGIFSAEKIILPKIATGRLDYDGSQVELSWTVAPEYRGRGYASALVWLLIQEAKKEWPGVLLVANIKPENTASIRAALKVGFEIRAGGMMRLERK